MSQSIAMPATAAYAGAPVTYAAPAPVTYAAPAAGPVTYAAPTYGAPAAASQYVPAAATVQGYQQYMQTPQYAQYHLGQQQYIQADTNHDGVVSATELQAAQPIKHGLFGQHHGFGIYDHFVNHGAGAAQLAAAQAQTAADPTAAALAQTAVAPTTFAYAAATQQGYQQYMQTPQYAQYHLTQQQYIQADANHDGKVTAAEVQAEAQSIIQHPTQPAPVVLSTASSMVAYPQVQTYMPQYQQYQQQFQFSTQPQLTAQEFAQADTNHDGKVSNQEIAAEVAKVAPAAAPVAAASAKGSKKKKVSKKKKGGCC